MSQKDFGKQFGIPMRTIQNWETGVRKPPEYVINLIDLTLRLMQRIVTLEKEIEELKKEGTD